jgi:hypothetical protein
MLHSSPRGWFKLEYYSGPDFPWKRVKDSIQRALDRGSIYTLKDIYDGISKSEMQLWVWESSALVTAIQTDKGGKTFCLLLVLGGKDMSTWFQYLPIVEDWAKDQGAEEMRVYGRIGWARLTGYDIEYTKMVKSLCPADQKT